MSASRLPRHRGTWSTLVVILIFALGVCIAIFGIFNLALNAMLGFSALALGISLIIPGVWWLRWYQKPRMLRGLIPVSLMLFIPGAVGTAMSLDAGEQSPEPEPIVTSTSPSSSTKPVPTSVVSEEPSETAITVATPTNTPPEEPVATTVIETPETVTVTFIPEPTTVIAPAPPIIPNPQPEPVVPTNENAPDPIDPVETPAPEEPPVNDSEVPVGEDPESEPEPTPAPAPAPANPWQDIINQFVR